MKTEDVINPRSPSLWFTQITLLNQRLTKLSKPQHNKEITEIESRIKKLEQFLLHSRVQYAEISSSGQMHKLRTWSGVKRLDEFLLEQNFISDDDIDVADPFTPSLLTDGLNQVADHYFGEQASDDYGPHPTDVTTYKQHVATFKQMLSRVNCVSAILGGVDYDFGVIVTSLPAPIVNYIAHMMYRNYHAKKE